MQYCLLYFSCTPSLSPLAPPVSLPQFSFYPAFPFWSHLPFFSFFVPPGMLLYNGGAQCLNTAAVHQCPAPCRLIFSTPNNTHFCSVRLKSGGVVGQCRRGTRKDMNEQVTHKLWHKCSHFLMYKRLNVVSHLHLG